MSTGNKSTNGRRGHGEGSISQRQDGRWEARVDLGWEDGKRKRKVVYGKTKREVLQKLAQAQRQKADGLPLPPERQMVEQYLLSWLEDVARPRLKPRTHVIYTDLLTRHVIPVLGKRPLAKLSPQELQALYGRKLAEGLAPQTVLNLHRVLHSALKHAVRWSLIARNPAELVDPPRVPRYEVRPLDADEVRRLLEAAAGDPLEALYVLALTTGMREGELLGLKWEDIDFAAGTLQVRRTIQRVRGVGFVEGEPKSNQSRRALNLPPQAVEALRRHRERQMWEEKQAGDLWEARRLVFCNSVGRPIEAGNLKRRSFWPLLKRAGIERRVRFHDLRHSVASLMMALGEDLKVIQEQLGHADISTTANIYGHLSASKKREAAMRLGILLSN